MPRYYRHIRQGDQLIQDPEGIDLPDLEAARIEAVQGIRDILGEAVKRGADDMLEDSIVIMDEEGQELMAISFVEALPSRLRDAILRPSLESSVMNKTHRSTQGDGEAPG